MTSDAEAQYDAAATSYHMAARNLEHATMAFVRAQIIERFPTATGYETTSEFTEDGGVNLRIKRIVAGDDVLFDVDSPAADETVDFVSDLGYSYLNTVIDITGEDYFGDHQHSLTEDA